MTARRTPFDSMYSHGYARVCCCVPRMRVVDPAFNAQRTLELARQAAADHAALAIFPELGLACYTADDLFHQDALLGAVERELGELVRQSADLATVLVVGAPLQFESKLFNCAVMIHRGRILGVVPKTFLPNYREFYEKRQFTSGRDALSRQVTVAGQTAPFGSDLLFEASDLPGFVLHVEICEDVWTPVPPSSWGALAGAS